MSLRDRIYRTVSRQEAVPPTLLPASPNPGRCLCSRCRADRRVEDATARAEKAEAELKSMTLSRNGANAMMGVHKHRADRLRAELDHAKAALAGDNEGVRLWMLDCDSRAARFREQVATWQRIAEEAEAERDKATARAEQAEATLTRVRLARRRIRSALIAVSDRLQAPYIDLPERTPWAQFVQPAMRALDAALDQPQEPT